MAIGCFDLAQKSEGLYQDRKETVTPAGGGCSYLEKNNLP